jgi:hypothetical protein
MRWKLLLLVAGVLMYIILTAAISCFLYAKNQRDKLIPLSLSPHHGSDAVTERRRDKQNSNKLDSLSDSQKMKLLLQTNDPIIKQLTRTGEPPLTKVRIILFDHKSRPIRFREGPTWAIGDEVLNICMDGFERSPYFEIVGTSLIPDFNVDPSFVLEEKEDVVWVVDMRRIVLRQSYSIHRQLVILANATIRDQEEKVVSGKLVRRPRLTIVLMDFRDRFSANTLCTKAIRELISLVGDNGSVRNVVQPVVRGRKWSDQRNFIVPGEVWDCRPDNECFGSSTLHVSYTVRSDYAEAVMKSFPQYQPISSQAITAEQNAADTERHIDVAHFWPHERDKPSEAHAKLRDAVTDVIKETSDSKGFNVIVDFVSAAAEQGRSQVSPKYVEALLTTKIVVVAQRDDWEDHYRLFEAIIGGALVMTDTMLSLPEGLAHKESIVVYSSLAELRELLSYYLDPRNEAERLSIARAGWKVAISRHRTYHWMERIFFGRIITM